MPIDPSISLGVQPVKMPNILEMALQGQSLQNQRLQGQGLQQNLAAQNAIGRIIQNNVNPDGSVNNAGVQRDMANDPDAAFLAQTATGVNQVQTGQQIANQASQFGLHKDYATVANETVAGGLVDPRITGADPNQPYDPEKAAQALAEAQAAMIRKGVPPEQALAAVAPFMMAAHQPGQIHQMLKDIVMGSQTAPQQMTTATPQVSMVPTIGADGKPVNQPTNMNTNAGPIAPIAGSTAQPMTIPPSDVEVPITDQYGHTVLVHRTGQGIVTSTRSVPGPANDTDTGFQNLPTGETPETLKTVQGIRLNANQAAASAPDQAFNANQIIKYADETTTGKGAGAIAGLKGTFAAIPWTMDSATNFNLLGHSIAQQTASLAASAGLNASNASRDLAAEMTADGDWTRPAIQSSARVMRAIGSTGAQLYNQGMENAVKTGNPFAARTFQNQWAQTANVDSLRLYDALKNSSSDPKALKQVVDSMDGPDSTRYNAALSTIRKMKSLIGK